MHELVVVDLDPTIPVGINLLERLGQLLDDDTSPDESIEGDSGLGPSRWSTTVSRDTGRGGTSRGFKHIVFSLDELEELRGQIVSELLQSSLELCTVDRTRTVPVKVLEDILPVLDVLPESSKLIESDGPAAVGVKDGHQELDSIEIEWTPISID